MDMGLGGRTALVSASTGGIGRAIALAFSREGARVIVNGRTEDRVADARAWIAEREGVSETVGLVADLGTREGCETAIAAHPAVDILVNNLGIYVPTAFFDTPDEEWRQLIEVNVMSGVRLCRHYLKGMLDRNRGRVVFISSESAVNPAPEMAHYSATKTMQLSLSRNLAELTKGSDVTVNSILPGPVHTEGIETFISSLFPEDFPVAQKRFMVENRPTSLIERLARPEEIADAVVFVASDRGSGINGAALRVDGGMVRSVF